ncbi:MAG: hypothetical protein Q9192_001074 [Flavoplaca navasiana]
MLDSDTKLESQLPSPASTPPPSPPNLTHPIQPQNTTLTQMASLPSTLPVTHARCTGSEGGIQPASNPYSPSSTSSADRVFTPKAASHTLRPSATTNVFASDTELEDDPASSHPVHCISSTQLPLSPPAPGPPRSSPKSPVRRIRRSSPSLITTRSKPSAAGPRPELQRSTCRKRRARRPAGSNLAGKATASAEGHGRRPLLRLSGRAD